MKSKITLSAVGSILFAAAALAHSGATGVIKERMESMGVMGDAIKRVAPMFQGEAAYDTQAVRDAAKTIKDHAGDSMVEQFPGGSNASPSEARAQIWSQWDDFIALATQLKVYAEALTLAADNPVEEADAMASESMMGGMGMMGGGDSMMGNSMMADDKPMMSADQLSKMPVDRVFTMVSQTCSACHTRFRADK
jgi:cytochrome c556